MYTEKFLVFSDNVTFDLKRQAINKTSFNKGNISENDTGQL